MTIQPDDGARAAYRIINPDGPEFTELSSDVRRLWRKAYAASREFSPFTIELDPNKTSIALCEDTFNHARTLMGSIAANRVFLYASSAYGKELRFLAEKYRCQWEELPPEALATKWTWIAVSEDGIVWARPTD